MKYYEQLLESFNKLKKRTFKLTISEGRPKGSRALRLEDEANALKQEVLNALTNAVGQTLTWGSPPRQIQVATDPQTPGRITVTSEGLYPNTIDLQGEFAKPKSDPVKKLVAWYKKSYGPRGQGLTEPTGTTDPGMVTEPTALMAKDTKDFAPGETVEAIAQGLILDLVKNPSLAGIGERFKEISKFFEKLCIDNREPSDTDVDVLQSTLDARLMDDKAAGRTEAGIKTDKGIKPSSKFRQIRGCEYLKSFLAGGRKWSLEYQVARGRKISAELTDKGIEYRERALDATEVDLSLKSLEELLRGLDSSSDGDVKKIEALKRALNPFKFLSDGSVVIEVGDGGGVVFRDTGGVLKGIVNRATDRYNELKDDDMDSIEVGELAKPKTSGSLAAIRGKMLESIKAYNMLRVICAEGREQTLKRWRNKGEGMEASKIQNLACVAAEEQRNIFLEKKEDFIKIHMWGLEYETGRAAISVEDIELINDLKEHGHNAENVIKIITSLQIMTDQADQHLKADMSLPVGDVAARENSGDKDDAIVVWKANCAGGEDSNNINCCAHAIANVTRGKKYKAGKAEKVVEFLPKGLTDLRDVVAGQPPAMKNFVNETFKDSGGLCVFRNGIKNSLTRSSVAAGVRKNMDSTMVGDRVLDESGKFTGEYNQRTEDIGITTAAYDQFRPESEKQITDPATGDVTSKGSTDAIGARVTKFWKNKIESIGSTIRELLPMLTVKDPSTGEVIEEKYDALEKHVKKQLDAWASDLSYDELQNLKVRKPLEGFLDEQGLQDDNGARKYISELVIRHDTIARLHKEIFGKGDGVANTPAARNALEAVAVGAFKTGGALRDTTTMEYHTIAGEGAGEMYSMRHNESMDFIKRGIDPNNADVEIIKSSNGIVFRDVNNPGSTVTFAVSRDKGKTKYRVDFSHEFVEANGSSYGPSSEQIASGKASLVTKFLDQQKKLFELLLN